jgi:hypothetical protein
VERSDREHKPQIMISSIVIYTRKRFPSARRAPELTVTTNTNVTGAFPAPLHGGRRPICLRVCGPSFYRPAYSAALCCLERSLPQKPSRYGSIYAAEGFRNHAARRTATVTWTIRGRRTFASPPFSPLQRSPRRTPRSSSGKRRRSPGGRGRKRQRYSRHLRGSGTFQLSCPPPTRPPSVSTQRTPKLFRIRA